MSERKDGGPAFPAQVPPLYRVEAEADGTATVDDMTSGMSLRDWFAGLALQGLVANLPQTFADRDMAMLSYQFADAMIAERSK